MKKQFPLLTILVSALLFISACTKIVATDIGGDLIPPVDGVNTKEMFLDVTTKNIKDTIVKAGITTPNALGYTDDPLFGKTNAAINVELKPASFPVYPVAGDDIKVDSVVLVLGYGGVWGDSTTHLGLRVYKVKNTDPAKDWLTDTIFYETDYQVERGDELTEGFTTADIDITKLNDSTHPFEEAAINQLRIRLNKDYGTTLLTGTGYDSTATGAYHSDSLFERFFKGYQIVPQYGDALLRINLLDTNTKLAIYYNYHIRDSALAKRDTAVRYFRSNNYSCGSSNYVTRDRSGTDIPKFIPENIDNNDSLLFVDANPGIFTRITIDSLSKLSNRIIHRAEIIMEQVPGDAKKDALFTPPNLFLTPITADSTPRFALPYDVVISSGAVVNQASFGCAPFKKTDPVTQQQIYYYTFDITRYAQGIITRKDSSYPLILYAPSNDYIYITESSIYSAYTGTSSGPLNIPAIGRVRLGGGNHSSHKMRLHIVYSDIK